MDIKAVIGTNLSEMQKNLQAIQGRLAQTESEAKRIQEEIKQLERLEDTQRGAIQYAESILGLMNGNDSPQEGDEGDGDGSTPDEGETPPTEPPAKPEGMSRAERRRAQRKSQSVIDKDNTDAVQ